MGSVGGSWECRGIALLASLPGAFGGSRKGGEVCLKASPDTVLEAISDGTGFLLISFTLVGVGGSRVGQTQASGYEPWKGWLKEDAVTTSSVVSGGDGGA